jgi:prenyltransferase beta subunit
MKAEMDNSLARGIDWLVSQQGEDGGWHSKTYGQLKDGAAVTSLILDSLSRAPQSQLEKVAAAVRNAFAFLDRGLAKRGAIAGPDGSLDFPTYAGALWLSAVNRMRRNDRRRSVADYLLGAQVAEPRGFSKESPSFGGWDFLGPEDAQGITTGTNISVTCMVLEALKSELGRLRKLSVSATDLEEIEATIKRAIPYVLRCQQADGGFAFTCEPASLNNKAAYSDTELTKPRSYGTATCDGIRAVGACGAKPDEEPLTKAIGWLARRPGLELVPGFEGFPPEAGWDRGLRFYYYAALSRVLPLFPLADRDARREALAKHVIGLQKDDGSWVNESDRMRENDPLIATALAVSALAGT